MYNWTRPDGCKDQILECEDRLKHLDAPTINRLPEEAAKICDHVESWCDWTGAVQYQKLDYGWLDIAHPAKDPFPPPHTSGYLADADVLRAIGSPVNWTFISSTVATSFQSTRDMYHGGFLDAIGYLLDHGVKVHMMYGDRDYACNWSSGEKASVAVPYSRSSDFASAEYAYMLSASGYSGLTRQVGNYSFTRVFQAGHEVPSYQPAAAYAIFMRATFNTDIATGLEPVTDELVTKGIRDAWEVLNELPERPEPRCYVRRPETCTDDVWEKVAAGKAIVKDYYVVGFEDDEGELVGGEEDGAQELFQEL